MRLIVIFLLLAATGLTLAQADNADNQETVTATVEFDIQSEQQAQALKAPYRHYSRCIRQVIFDNADKVGKAALIATECEAEREALANFIPEAVRDYALLNLDRRMANILKALDDANNVVADTQQDVADVIELLTTD